MRIKPRAIATVLCMIFFVGFAVCGVVRSTDKETLEIKQSYPVLAEAEPMIMADLLMESPNLTPEVEKESDYPLTQEEIDLIALVTIATVIQTIMTALSTLKNKIKEKFESANFELFHSLLERIHERMTQVGEAAGEMKSGVIVAFEVIGEALANCQFVQLLSAVWNAVKTIGSGIVKILGELGSSLAKNLGEANFSGIIDLLNGISFGAIAVGITKFVGTFRKAIEDIGSFKESFIGILDSVRGCFEAYQTQLQAGTLLKIASAIAILTASLIALSLVDSEKLNVALGAITVLFAELLASMAVFNKISGQATGVMKSVTAMLGIATAVLILASALKKIADLDAKQLTTGLIGVAGLTAMMVAAAKAMSSNSKTIIKGATQMVMRLKVLIPRHFFRELSASVCLQRLWRL